MAKIGLKKENVKESIKAALPLIFLFATLGLYLLFLMPRLFWEKGDELWVGHIHLWSDWPFHLAMARQFADNPPAHWLDHHPMVAGEPLRYPFFSAFLSGMLLRLGLSLRWAILLPNIVFIELLLLGMYRFWQRLLNNNWLALLPISLFFSRQAWDS